MAVPNFHRSGPAYLVTPRRDGKRDVSADTDDIDDNGDATDLRNVASTAVNITSALYTLFGDGRAARVDDEKMGYTFQGNHNLCVCVYTIIVIFSYGKAGVAAHPGPVNGW
jgi:hypothetical protein